MIFNDMLLSGGLVQDLIVVTITGRSSTNVYDNADHSVSGYTVSISDPQYTVNDFVFSGTASASGTNVGMYNMGLDASQFTNITPKFRNIRFDIVDGYVKITGKPVTVTAANKSKTYGGTDPALTATVSGTIGSDTVSYSISRTSGNNAGTYTITPSGAATQGNYTVSYVSATFTINPASCTLKANSGTKTYNKSAQSVTGFTSTPAGLSFSGVSASGSRTNAGSSSVTFSGVTVNSTKDTTGNYVVTGVTNGTITINPAGCTLTANSGTKTYNAASQSVTGFTSNPSGLSFSGVSASGSGTNAGSYSVTFSGVTVNSTKDTTGNYVVTGVTNGSLTIGKRTVATVTITGNSGTYNYNGANQTVSGYTFSSSDSLYTTSMCTVSGASVTRKANGTSTMSITAANNNSNFTVTKINITNGSITINKITLQLYKANTGALVEFDKHTNSYSSALAGGTIRSTAYVGTNYMEVSGNSWYVSSSEYGDLSASIVTKNAINLALYNKLIIDGYSSSVGVSISCGSSFTLKNTSRGTYEFDISAAIGSAKISFYGGDSSQGAIMYNVWLES